jgi:hypothetical protein
MKCSQATWEETVRESLPALDHVAYRTILPGAKLSQLKIEVLAPSPAVANFGCSWPPSYPINDPSLFPQSGEK